MDAVKFEKIYNDIVKYPTIAKVAAKLKIHGRTVGKQATKLREQGVKLANRSTSYKKDETAKIMAKVPEYRTPTTRNEKNSSIFVISDMHVPYHHQDMIAYFKAIKKKYKPDRIICIGDELDNHAMSYHDSDPDVYSAGYELERAREVIKEVEKIFPNVDLVDSNHGSLFYRKAKSNGIPREALVSYNKLLGVGEGWRWHFDLTIEMSDGMSVYFHHGKVSDALVLSQRAGMSAVQGHYHSKFKVDHWSNTKGLYFGMAVGCLIDDNALAFSYNKNTTDRPIIGCGIILNGQAKLIPLVKKSNGRWDGKLA